ncbi:response regulator transcription factor [Pedobacter aquatilis]|uniref:response regulator transcription factor n=1 Tax=Pedobacter aquatilis TaxID=351343 RepID=UPI00292CB198|nr:response regulator transcription factor [Pedobacter aquatilis]
MISISIVEDHDNYRNSLVKAVEENGLFKINDVYSSAEEALIQLPLNPPDIAVVDIKLKSISGIELIQRVKPSLEFTQFLMCSGYQNNEYVFNALKAGASGYIVKGSSAIEIQNAIIDLYNGGSPMSPYIARKVINLLHHKSADNNEFGLSSRELEVLSLLSEGLLYKEISDRLQISQNTVKNHCKNIYKRLHVQNKVEALNKFNQYNLGSNLANS